MSDWGTIREIYTTYGKDISKIQPETKAVMEEALSAQLRFDEMDAENSIWKAVGRYLEEHPEAKEGELSSYLQTHYMPTQPENIYLNSHPKKFTKEIYESAEHERFGKEYFEVTRSYRKTMKKAVEAAKKDEAVITSARELFINESNSADRIFKGMQKVRRYEFVHSPRGVLAGLGTLIVLGLGGYLLSSLGKGDKKPVNTTYKRPDQSAKSATLDTVAENKVDSTKTVIPAVTETKSDIKDNGDQEVINTTPIVQETVTNTNPIAVETTDKKAETESYPEYVVGSDYVIQKGDTSLYKIARKLIHEYYASIGQQISDDDITETQLANCKRAMEKAAGFNQECVETNEYGRCTKYRMYVGDKIPRIDIAKVLGLDK